MIKNNRRILHSSSPFLGYVDYVIKNDVLGVQDLKFLRRNTYAYVEYYFNGNLITARRFSYEDVDEEKIFDFGNEVGEKVIRKWANTFENNFYFQYPIQIYTKKKERTWADPNNLNIIKYVDFRNFYYTVNNLYLDIREDCPQFVFGNPKNFKRKYIDINGWSSMEVNSWYAPTTAKYMDEFYNYFKDVDLIPNYTTGVGQIRNESTWSTSRGKSAFDELRQNGMSYLYWAYDNISDEALERDHFNYDDLRGMMYKGELNKIIIN